MVRITLLAKKQFQALPAAIQVRVESIFDRLEKWPEVSGVKPLRGNLVGHYRLRTGDFRVQFQVTGTTVTIEHIGHRDGFYD
jgi:mRNA-degrading endonuclease RelE of RelBE toxin-antitoxin system